ncbi:MAG TPA: hypothetical protein VFN09_01695 [Rhodanobacteraceae bacterium]|nr:hypothetical protein [Rhodanobacteraceae bacterium]
MKFSRHLRRLFGTALLVAGVALMTPAAVAGGWPGHRHHDNAWRHGYYGHPVIRHDYGPVRVYPRRLDTRRYVGYRDGYRYRPYRPHYRHDHWRVGEVVGALVVGSILADVISDAVQPRTRVVERRVVSGPYYRDATPPTRYIGSDSGYYEDH